MASRDNDTRAAIMRLCIGGGCPLLADEWAQKGLSINEVQSRIAALEEIRLRCRYFTYYDEGAQILVRAFPAARALALALDFDRGYVKEMEAKHEGT